MHTPNLSRLGFIEIEEDTTDSSRWVWFRKGLYRVEALIAIIELKFSLTIEDDPYATYNENLFYSFEQVTFLLTDGPIEYNGDLESSSDYSSESRRLSIEHIADLEFYLLLTDKLKSFF